MFSTDNTFYHNWFVHNVNHTYIDQGSPNVWNATYPMGGNYWDDFAVRYPGVGNEFSGPDQDVPGPDGFWDGPYENDVDNVDHYPIVPEFPAFLILPLVMIGTLLATMYYRRKPFQKR
jgi:hypothetical protein